MTAEELKEYHREYYRRNRERLLKLNHENYRKYGWRKRAYAKKYYEKNKERICARQKAIRDKLKEENELKKLNYLDGVVVELAEQTAEERTAGICGGCICLAGHYCRQGEIFPRPVKQCATKVWKAAVRKCRP